MAGPKSARISKTNSQEQVNFIFVSSAHLLNKVPFYAHYCTYHNIISPQLKLVFHFSS